jgi:hypothetical protein
MTQSLPGALWQVPASRSTAASGRFQIRRAMVPKVVVADVQRRFFDPPQLASKWAR